MSSTGLVVSYNGRDGGQGGGGQGRGQEGEVFVSEIVGKVLDEVYSDPVDGVVGVEEVVGKEAMG